MADVRSVNFILITDRLNENEINNDITSSLVILATQPVSAMSQTSTEGITIHRHFDALGVTRKWTVYLNPVHCSKTILVWLETRNRIPRVSSGWWLETELTSVFWV